MIRKLKILVYRLLISDARWALRELTSKSPAHPDVALLMRRINRWQLRVLDLHRRAR